MTKNSFSVHGVDTRAKVVLRKKPSHAKLLPFLARVPPCLAGMEACSGAHHWGLLLTGLGHRVGIMAPSFVAPYCNGGTPKPMARLLYGTGLRVFEVAPNAKLCNLCPRKHMMSELQ